MTTNQVFAAVGVSILLLAVVVYVTRAGYRRVLGAAVGGLVMVAFGISIDALGDAMGWWHYTMGTPAHGPALLYLAIWIWYGVGVQLIGWRVSRRFGVRGLVAFIGFMAIYGPLRDYIGIAATSGTVQVVSSGIVPVVADVLLWGTMNALAQGVMWLVAGSPESDRLRYECQTRDTSV